MKFGMKFFSKLSRSFQGCMGGWAEIDRNQDFGGNHANCVGHSYLLGWIWHTAGLSVFSRLMISSQSLRRVVTGNTPMRNRDRPAAFVRIGKRRGLRRSGLVVAGIGNTDLPASVSFFTKITVHLSLLSFCS